MRFNERELIAVAEGPPVVEGTLQYMKPQNDWYQQALFKERQFRLVNNLLFYFRVNDTSSPLGVLVLEDVRVSYEFGTPGAAFTFSLSFQDSKHIFACRCLEDMHKWVLHLKMASYDYWRSLYTILRTQISDKTGHEPIITHRNHGNGNGIINRRINGSVFYCTRDQSNTSTNSHVPTDNLIEL